MTPTISTALDLDDGLWHIEATSYGRTQPAGPRLFRAQPWPDIQFQHDTQEAAERDAAKLRAYLEGATKGPSRARLRKQGAD
jgi:hypothetical protein